MTTERRNFLKAVSAAASTAVLAGTQALPRATCRPQQSDALSSQTDALRSENHHGHLGKVLISHYENNYVGAVKRLNAIGTQLASGSPRLEFRHQQLKREELVASNSMILHEIYFDGLGGGAEPVDLLPTPSRVSAVWSAGDRVRSDGQGGRRWFGLGDPRVLSRQAARQPMGRRPHRDAWAVVGLSARYVRARLSHGLRCGCARYVDVYLEAIRWDNAAKLYEQYSRET